MDSTASSSVPRLVHSFRESIGKVVVGQDEVVERLLIALLTGGHLLLQGVPGLAKTLLVSAAAHAIDLTFGRIQFTIDLLPADIIGSEILDQRSGSFHVNRGPIFANLLLADEINRAAPKVQSALLEAMQERRVTIGKETHSLPSPFLVIATQNPVEQAGTFELPEAQLDRFMMCHRLSYPSREQETSIIQQSLSLGVNRKDGGAVPKTAFDLIQRTEACKVEDLVQAMEQVKRVFVSAVFTEHVVELLNRTRNHPLIELGASPRAGIAIVAASQARAFIHGRDHVLPEDLLALAEDVYLHRLRVSYEALADGISGKQILQQILNSLG